MHLTLGVCGQEVQRLRSRPIFIAERRVDGGTVVEGKAKVVVLGELHSNDGAPDEVAQRICSGGIGESPCHAIDDADGSVSSRTIE